MRGSSESVVLFLLLLLLLLFLLPEGWERKKEGKGEVRDSSGCVVPFLFLLPVRGKEERKEEGKGRVRGEVKNDELLRFNA